MPNITVNHQVLEYDSKIDKNLLSCLLRHGVLIENPCAGKGVCGKCKVQIIGDCPITQAQSSLLKEEEIQAGIRLACMVEVYSDIEVILFEKERKHKILSDGYVPEFEFLPAVSKVCVQIKRASIEDQTPVEEQIRAQVGEVSIDYKVWQNFSFEAGTWTAVCIKEEDKTRVCALELGDTTKESYGLAIDIGTTTVVVSLISLMDGKELGSASAINAQKEMGLDVLSRITYETEYPKEGKEKLQSTMVHSLNQLIEQVCNQCDVSMERIYEAAIAANSTMMHMLLGIDARTIGKSPYAPIFINSKNIKASQIGLKVSSGARIYTLPSVSAYIGADISAGAYVCGLHKTNDKILFIDIGTNGEIVLSNKGKMLCCSCAAGPALEGMNISCGMRAAEGAIEDVHITEEGVQLKVIGDTKPVGICGSGILAVGRELVRTGLLQKNGTFIKKEKLLKEDYRYPMIQMEGKKRNFVLSKSSNLMITQSDIRQLQFAKGAILSGFLALLNEAGIDMSELNQVMIAGQFGAHLSPDSLTGTGILPKEVEDKIVYVGNSSKTGAYMALMSVDARKELEETAKKMRYMELSNTKEYERLFASCTLFE